VHAERIVGQSVIGMAGIRRRQNKHVPIVVTCLVTLLRRFRVCLRIDLGAIIGS
jgi:hypothetical protein